MKKKLGLLILLALTAACAENGGNTSIPEPYRGQIAALRTDTFELEKKIGDLNKQTAELRAQEDWDHARAGLLATQALEAAGKSPTEYKVSIDMMEIQPINKR